MGYQHFPFAGEAIASPHEPDGVFQKGNCDNLPLIEGLFSSFIASESKAIPFDCFGLPKEAQHS
ncbi:MAG: hypothetical protein ACPLPS_05170 [bacterium]